MAFLCAEMGTDTTSLPHVQHPYVWFLIQHLLGLHQQIYRTIKTAENLAATDKKSKCFCFCRHFTLITFQTSLLVHAGFPAGEPNACHIWLSHDSEQNRVWSPRLSSCCPPRSRHVCWGCVQTQPVGETAVACSGAEELQGQCCPLP